MTDEKEINPTQTLDPQSTDVESLQPPPLAETQAPELTQPVSVQDAEISETAPAVEPVDVPATMPEPPKLEDVLPAELAGAAAIGPDHIPVVETINTVRLQAGSGPQLLVSMSIYRGSEGRFCVNLDDGRPQFQTTDPHEAISIVGGAPKEKLAA